MSKAVRYVAKTHLSIRGVGNFTPGEYIPAAKAALMNKEQIEWLISAGGIEAMRAAEPVPAAEKPEEKLEEPETAEDETSEDETEADDGEESVPVEDPIDLDMLDEEKPAEKKTAAKTSRKGVKA